jgi:hypothetical protein
MPIRSYVRPSAKLASTANAVATARKIGSHCSFTTPVVERWYAMNSKLMSPAAKHDPATMYNQFARVNPIAVAVDGPPSSRREGTGKVTRAAVSAARASSDGMSNQPYAVRKSTFRYNAKAINSGPSVAPVSSIAVLTAYTQPRPCLPVE